MSRRRRRKRPAPEPTAPKPLSHKAMSPAAAGDEWAQHIRLCWICRYGSPCDTGSDLRRAWEKLANEAMDLIWKR